MKKMLWMLLVGAFLVRIYNINYNTPFIDEAQYIMVGLQILGGDIEGGIGAISWVGGSPFFYPLLSALFYQFGGLIGSRVFTVLLGTVCVFLMYQFTKQLLFFKNENANKKAGLIAASFMAVTTIAVTTSRLAIYDALAFTLFFLGVVLFHKAIYTGERKFYLNSAVVLFLSFLAKYIVAIFFPFFFFVPIYLAIKTKNIKGVQGIITYFCLPFLLLMGVYIGNYFTSLQEFFIDQGVVSASSQTEVVQLFADFTLFSYLLFFLGAWFFWRTRQMLVVVLLFFSFIPLVIHTLTNNASSVQQHTFLSLIFVLPLVGAMFTVSIQKFSKLGKVFLLCALAVQVLITVPQVQEAESFWPNLTESTRIIESDLDTNDRILGEAGDSLYLALKEKIPYDQFDGPFVFSYGDQEGISAYTQAINNGYFKYVQLEGTYFSEEDGNAIKKAMEGRYRKFFDNGMIQVYKLST